MDETLIKNSQFIIRQKKEWGEILTNFETRNRYVIQDDGGEDLWYAGERSEGVLAFFIRSFLKALRPFTIELFDLAGTLLLTFKRPWRWYFHRLEVSADGRLIGAVQKRWKVLGRLFDIQGSQGEVCGQIYGPLLHPWTFHVSANGREIGKITKKWSGFGKEIFTDADTFFVEIDAPDLSVEVRKVILGATFLIDFLHFENKGNN